MRQNSGSSQSEFHSSLFIIPPPPPPACMPPATYMALSLSSIYNKERVYGTMVSKAWYKSAAPRLIGKFTNTSSSRKKAVEIWTTTCILTNFGKQCRHNSENISNDHQQQPLMTLINPANPNLSGPNAFPYFPRGGPQPKVQPNRHAHHISK